MSRPRQECATARDAVPPVAEGVFTLPPYDEAPPQLLGGACPEGHGPFFPRPTYCPECLTRVNETSLGSDGVVYSFTVVRVRAPLGFPNPYGVGYVDLSGSGLRVFCLLDPDYISEFEIGRRVRLDVRPFGVDVGGHPRLRPVFTPAENGEVRGAHEEVTA